jgi:hypothetical protein
MGRGHLQSAAARAAHAGLKRVASRRARWGLGTGRAAPVAAARYPLTAGGARAASWAPELREHLQGLLGDLPGGATAIRLHEAGMASTTAGSYSGHWGSFTRYCETAGRAALPAAPTTVMGYVGAIAERGTVAAASLRPYLSAINRVHRDFGKEPPAEGHNLKVIKQGLGALQMDNARKDARLYLPAEVVSQVVDRGLQDSTLPDETRRCGAVGLAYLSLQRVSTSVGVQERDLGVDDTHLWFRERERKGQDGRQTVPEEGDMRVLRFPLSSPGVARVAAVIRRWRHLRGQVAPDRPLFCFPRENGPTKALAGTWLSSVLEVLGVRPPQGFAYTYHSLRKGGATGAYSIGVPELSIQFLGGWSLESTSARRYINFTCAASEAARSFFGWLLPGGQ